MIINVDASSGVCHIDIKDEMTIYTASTLKHELLDQLTHHDSLQVSLEGVTEMDSAGVQIMLLLKKEQQSLKKELRFVKHSQPVIDVLEMFNLSGHFGDPIVLPAEGA